MGGLKVLVDPVAVGSKFHNSSFGLDAGKLSKRCLVRIATVLLEDEIVDIVERGGWHNFGIVYHAGELLFEGKFSSGWESDIRAAVNNALQ